MKILFIIMISVLLNVTAYGAEWSINQVMKFTPAIINNYNGIADYESIKIEKDFLTLQDSANGWLQTETISLEKDYILSSAFVHFTQVKTEKASTNSRVKLCLINEDTGKTILEKIFFSSGSMDLTNVFYENYSLRLEIYGSDILIESFGLTRKKLVIINTNEIIVKPDILFYGEEKLNIKFNLFYPVFLDIILFNEKGTIIDYLSQRKLFKEGTYNIEWDPEQSKSPNLSSGKYIVYFNIKALNGKQIEATKKFLFAKK